MRSIIKYYIIRYLSGFILLGLLSCNDPDKASVEKKTMTDTTANNSIPGKPVTPAIVLASMAVVAPDSVRKDFQNLISMADCASPLGKYTTQINIASDGYMYFKQVFSYKRETFEAVLSNNSAWFSLNDSVGRLPNALIFFVRSHAFHSMLLEVPERFHDFENAGTANLLGKILNRVKAK